MQLNKAYCMLLLLLFIPSTYALNKTVHLVTGEREPYIGQSLPNNGYVSEIVSEAFQREGYSTELIFYPWARAKALLPKLKLDGIVPVYPGDRIDKDFIISAPFPGGSVGLLKRKEDHFPYAIYSAHSLMERLQALTNLRIALVRDSGLLPLINQFPNIKLIKVDRDLQSLDMLSAGRVNFALIDKYTAAKLMIDKRPHYIGRLEFVRPELSEEKFHIAFSKHSGNSDILSAAFNRGLNGMLEDGTLHSIRSRHGLLPSNAVHDDNVHLTIGTVNNPDMRIMRSLSDEFEQQHPGIKLEWQEMEEYVLRHRLLSDLALSEAHFDVMMIGNYEVPIWAEKHWLTPLDSPPDNYLPEDILPALIEALSYRNKLYAAPFYAESIMTYYRKDLFKLAGIHMPSQPTFADIQRFSQQLHSPENHIYGICLRGKADWGQNTSIVTSFVNAFGGQWFNQKWEPQLNSPEWKAALNNYSTLISQYGPPNSVQNGYLENLNLFSQGHCAIWIDVTVAAGQLYNPNVSSVADKVGFAAAPKNIRPANWLWSWALAIPKSSTNEDAAMAFIHWATSREYIQRVAETSGWISVPPGTRFSTYSTPEYQQKAPFAPFVLNALKNVSIKAQAQVPYVGVQYVGIPEFVGIGSLVGENIAEVLRGNISVDEALKQSQAQVFRQMRDSGYLK